MQCTDKQQKTVCGPTEKSRTTAHSKPYQALGGVDKFEPVSGGGDVHHA
jgi:hypothetical protein